MNHNENVPRNSLGLANYQNTFEQYYLPRQNKLTNNYSQRSLKQIVMPKLQSVCEQVYEMMILKQGLNTMLKDQKIKMGDMLRQLKKYLFQLDIKAQRQAGKDVLKDSQVFGQTSIHRHLQSCNKNADNQVYRQLQALKEQNQMLREKYEAMLYKYRQEIQFISASVGNQQQNGLGDQGLKMQLKQSQKQLKECQERLRDQQERYVQKITYLQSALADFQSQYLQQKKNFEKQMQKYRQRQKKYAFQEAQLQRKNVLLIQRQKALAQKQILFKQQKNNVDRRQAKVSDFQHNQLRRERNQAIISRQNLRSQYYLNQVPQHRNMVINNHQGTPSQYNHNIRNFERDNSAGKRLVSSRIDINARLKQIEHQRRKGGLKGSRVSQAVRSVSRDRQNMVAGVDSTRHLLSPTSGNVNMKLTTMLDSLQKDLSDIK